MCPASTMVWFSWHLVGRPAEMLSFASFNTDGPPPSLPPRPPSPPALQTNSILKLWRRKRMNSDLKVEFNNAPFNYRIAVLSMGGEVPMETS